MILIPVKKTKSETFCDQSTKILAFSFPDFFRKFGKSWEKNSLQ